MNKIDSNNFKIQFLPCREHGPSALQRPAVFILYRLIVWEGASYVPYKKEGELDWSHLTSDLPSKTRYWRKDCNDWKARRKT